MLLGNYSEIFYNIEEFGITTFLSLILNMIIMYCFHIISIINFDDVDKKNFSNYMNFYSKYFMYVYVPFLLVIFFFTSLSFSRDMSSTVQMNLIPFKTITYYFSRLNGSYINVINLVGNILLFVPLGFFIPQISLSNKFKKLTHINLLILASSIFIEVFQLLLLKGIFDVDDIILNTSGGLLGYFAIITYNWIPEKVYSLKYNFYKKATLNQQLD